MASKKKLKKAPKIAQKVIKKKPVEVESVDSAEEQEEEQESQTQGVEEQEQEGEEHEQTQKVATEVSVKKPNEVNSQSEPTAEVDLNKYTIGTSGQAPVQAQNVAELESNSVSPDKKKKVMGFGLSPKLEDVIEEDIPLERRNRRLYYIGIVITAFILGVTSATLYFRIQQGELGTSNVEVETEEPVEVAENESSESPEPTSTPTPRSEITLEILNGSGVAGLAGDTADTFIALGYEVGDTGNTDSTNGNQLYIQKDLDEASLKFLLDDVKDELDITEITAELSDLEVTARIVLGSQSEESSDESTSSADEE